MAIAAPVDGGSISVRLKPTSPLFEAAKQIYADVRPLEERVEPATRSSASRRSTRAPYGSPSCSLRPASSPTTLSRGPRSWPRLRAVNRRSATARQRRGRRRGALSPRRRPPTAFVTSRARGGRSEHRCFCLRLSQSPASPIAAVETPNSPDVLVARATKECDSPGHARGRRWRFPHRRASVRQPRLEAAVARTSSACFQALRLVA